MHSHVCTLEDSVTMPASLHACRHLEAHPDLFEQWVSVLDLLAMFVDALPLMEDEDAAEKPSGELLRGALQALQSMAHVAASPTWVARCYVKESHPSF